MSPVSYVRASTTRMLFERRSHHDFLPLYMKRKWQLQLYFVMRLIACADCSENTHLIESRRGQRKMPQLPDRFSNKQTMELIDQSLQTSDIYVSEGM